MAFVMGTIGMVAVLVAILLLATSKPQGSLVPLDTAAFDQQVAAATSALEGYEDLGDGRTRFVSVSLFHTTAERDGMLHSGMEGGMNESYAALDKVLATLA